MAEVADSSEVSAEAKAPVQVAIWAWRKKEVGASFERMRNAFKALAVVAALAGGMYAAKMAVDYMSAQHAAR